MIYKPCKCQMLADTVSGSDSQQEGQQRVCPGHERAVHIQKAIEKLNISEQGVLLFIIEIGQFGSIYLGNRFEF